MTTHLWSYSTNVLEDWFSLLPTHRETDLNLISSILPNPLIQTLSWRCSSGRLSRRWELMLEHYLWMCCSLGLCWQGSHQLATTEIRSYLWRYSKTSIRAFWSIWIYLYASHWTSWVCFRAHHRASTLFPSCVWQTRQSLISAVRLLCPPHATYYASLECICSICLSSCDQ